MTELNAKYILLFVIATFLLYHLIGNCGCRVEGFTYDMKGEETFDCDMAKQMAMKAVTVMDCKTAGGRTDLINLSNTWCNSLGGDGNLAQNQCVQEHCTPVRDGKKIECKTPF